MINNQNAIFLVIRKMRLEEEMSPTEACTGFNETDSMVKYESSNKIRTVALISFYMSF